jgi:hypothetical protein
MLRAAMKSVFELLNTPEGPYFGPLLGGNPDPAPRERYRAWLEAQGDERAELFAIEDALLRDDEPGREAAIARAQEILAKSAHVREWWRFVTRTSAIRNCGKGPRAFDRVRFSFECPRTWESLAPTDEAGARHCDSCARLVYLCRSAEEAERRARRGDCVTLSASSWREHTSELTRSYTGRPDPIAIWASRVFPGEGSEG